MKSCLLLCAMVLTLLFGGLNAVYAGSATWSANPATDDWNTASNWTPATVPNGPTDTATFGHTQLRQAETSQSTEVNGIIFNPPDSSFSVLVTTGNTFTISGTGITNSSGFRRDFSCSGILRFTNSAIAGSQMDFTVGGSIGADPAGVLQFSDATNANRVTVTNFHSQALAGSGGVTEVSGTTSVAGAHFTNQGGLFEDSGGAITKFSAITADTATFTNMGGTGDDTTGGLTQFSGSATAGFATITNEGGTGDGEETGGLTEFLESTSAGNAAIVNEPGGLIHDLIFPFGGRTIFHDDSTAGTATLTTEVGEPNESFAGTITFFDNSTADHATFNDAGEVTFYDSSTAANGAFILTPGDLRGVVSFYGTSTAGNAVFTILDGAVAFNEDSSAANASVIRAEPSQVGSLIIFRDSATADHANLIANGNTDSVEADNDSVEFDDESTAANATITLNAGAGSDSTGALGFFNNEASAGNSVITANGAATSGDSAAALLEFSFHSTASNATLIANGGANGGLGGEILFSRDGQGGEARIELFGNGRLVLGEDRHAISLTIGSLEGDGLVFLGGQQLQVGSNDLSTTFSGLVQDAGAGGSLTKIGSGRLTFTNGNTFTGGTIVNGGILLANNSTGSATGRGAVQVNAGTFGGGGAVAGAVTVGTGSGTGAILGPGADGSSPGTFTIKNKLTLMADATYRVLVNSDTPATDSVNARGVRIRGAQIAFDDRGTSVLAPGAVFIVINNTATTAITGSFANLPEGSTITIGNNTYQANYHGGDGNDLTLTVVS